ncbi:MAG TPA: PQQ-binding-like beta-propeller repeat protein [Candidatus Baltobacteraceae bacterium]|jgi:outer membrane protein assembly factor BamB|nr:PQQ-binding-like beta-propeller repeat protein [Candidatus Baltobacteraceae bacterium]
MPLRFGPAARLAAILAAASVLSACGGSGSVPSSNPQSLGASAQAAGGLAATASIETTGTASWPQPFMNGAHTGFNTLETTLNRTNVKTLTQLWSFPTGAQITDPVLVQNGVAYVNSGDGYLYALNATTGAQIWKYETYESTSTQNAPVISNGRIVVPCLVAGNSQKNAMCGINISTGMRQWAYYDDCNCLPPAGVSAGAVASGSTVVFDYADGSTGSSYVAAVNAATGARIWASAALPHGPDFYSAAIGGGQVYYNTGSGLCAASLTSGTTAWCATVGSEPAMAYSGGVLYVNTSNNGVYAFNASTGTQIWQYTPTAGNYSGNNDPPAVANGVVYVSGVGFNGNLYAINASNGSLIYNTSADGSAAYTTSSPTVAHNVVYVECGSFVCAFNSATGALLYSPGSSGTQQVSPAVVNGVVYSACGPNSACAYGLPGAAKRHI